MGIQGEEKQKLCCMRHWRTSKYFYSFLLFLCEREQPSRLGWFASDRDFGKVQSKSMIVYVYMCVLGACRRSRICSFLSTTVQIYVFRPLLSVQQAFYLVM